LVRDADDVLEVLAAAVPPVADTPEPPKEVAQKRSLRDTAALHSAILDRLGPSPVAEDQLVRDLHVVPTDIAPILVDLELEGRITRHAGGLLAKAP
jgi:DNA processing protein